MPKLNSFSQDWVQRGTTTEVTVSGENLGSANFVISGEAGIALTLVSNSAPNVTIESSGGGISAANVADDKSLVAKIMVKPEALLGAREIRVVTPDGTSNPLTLNVAAEPQVLEKTPNNSATAAQPIELPIAVLGRIAAANEIDHFRFKATKGQHLIFEVYAARIGSPLDSSLAVLDANGKELARNEDAVGLDSVLHFEVPADGEYLAQVRDYR